MIVFDKHRPVARVVAWMAITTLYCTGCPQEAEDDFVRLLGGSRGFVGACCTDDGCASFVELTCLEESGVYFADESCGSFSPCRGACCRNNECFMASSKNECEGTGGEFQGIRTNCDIESVCADPPPDDINDSEQFGICCLGGACVGIPLAECTETVFFEADDCNDIDCAMGACCDTLLDECSESTQRECALSAFGEYAGPGTKCADTNCGLGACCTSDGSTCTDVTDAQCLADGGAFKGIGTNCDRHQCLAAPCCRSDGSCVELVPEACRTEGGASLPVGKVCADQPCSVGLCCSLFPSDQPFGDCRDDFTQGGCEAQAGTFAGLGLTCADNTFEAVTVVSITDLSNTPETGTLGDTSFTLNVTWAGAVTFPIRVQGYIDVAGCPPDVSCPAVSRRVDFRVEQAEGKTVTIPDWNQCPGLTTVAGYAEPWRFRIVDQHCVASNAVPLLLQCTP